MAQKTINQLKSDVTEKFTSNANREITGARLASWANDILDSLAHNSKAGLQNFVNTTPYLTGECVVYEGKIFQFTQSHLGAWNSNKVIDLTKDPSRFNFPDYVNSTTYQEGDIVEYNLRIYKFINASSISGVAPDAPNGSDYWEEVSPSTGAFGLPWEAGAYEQGDVVRYDDQLYELQSMWLLSTDIEAEIESDLWKIISVTSSLQFYNEEDLTPITQPLALRFMEFLEGEYNAFTNEIEVDLKADKIQAFVSDFFHFIGNEIRLRLSEGKIYFGNSEDTAEEKTLEEVFTSATAILSTLRFHEVAGVVEPFLEEGKIQVGNANAVPEAKTLAEAVEDLSVEMFNDAFVVDVDGKVKTKVNEGEFIKGNANGVGESAPLIVGEDNALLGDGAGGTKEVGTVKFVNQITGNSTTNGLIPTVDLSLTARGQEPGYAIDYGLAINLTANTVTIDLGHTINGTEFATALEIPGNATIEIPFTKRFVSSTIETGIYATSANWNSAEIKFVFNTKKVM